MIDRDTSVRSIVDAVSSAARVAASTTVDAMVEAVAGHIEELKLQLERLKSQLDGAKKAESLQIEINGNLQHDLERARRTIQEKDGLAAGVEVELDELRGRVVRLMGEKDDAETAVGQRDRHLVAQLAANEEMARRVADAEKRLAVLIDRDREIAALKVEVGRSEVAVAAARAETEAMKEEVVSAAARYEQLAKERDACYVEIAKFKTMNEELRSRVTGLQKLKLG